MKYCIEIQKSDEVKMKKATHNHSIMRAKQQRIVENKYLIIIQHLLL